MADVPGDRDGPAVQPSGPFYSGIIRRLFPGRGVGVVRSASGREIQFLAAHVALSGAVHRFADLREGMAVGFDVGWTSKGLRVTRLHVTS